MNLQGKLTNLFENVCLSRLQKEQRGNTKVHFYIFLMKSGICTCKTNTVLSVLVHLYVVTRVLSKDPIVWYLLHIKIQHLQWGLFKFLTPSLSYCNNNTTKSVLGSSYLQIVTLRVQIHFSVA